jgi:hypothetical protein
MSKTVVVMTCAHAKAGVSNERFEWLGKFLYDTKPDMFIDLGDFDDLPSLNSYDTRYPKAIVSQNYQEDIEAGQDARERIWHKFKRNKKALPFRVGFEGNHEHRLKRALELDPRIEGDKYGISFKNLQTDYWYDEYHEYANSAPKIACYDGVSYAHYFTSGNSSNATSGTHHAYSILQNRNSSSTCGHSHKRSIYFKDGAYPNGIIGLVAGCFKGSDETWAGQSNLDWWKGIIIKREVSNGTYEPEFVSMKQLEREYK